MILKAVFHSASGKAAENFDWVYRHHIAWEQPAAEGIAAQVLPSTGKRDVA
jgi:hypothetical protein